MLRRISKGLRLNHSERKLLFPLVQRLPWHLKNSLLIIFIFLAFGNIHAQDQQLRFEILKNSRSIGFLKIEKLVIAPFTDYKVSSLVEVTILKKFRVTASEKFRYKNDLLIYSSVERRINKNPEDQKELIYKENQYIVYDGEGKRIFAEPEINANLVLLYFTEPLNVHSVYCDNLQRMVEIKKAGKNSYRLDFPNGVSNIFHYTNGKCTSVNVHAKFFKVQFVNKSI